MQLTLTTTVKLNNGVMMPLMGLGTFKSSPGKETRDSVLWALEAGYRHIDTATIYQNEEDVGAALRESGIPREQIFVTTKVWNGDQGYESTLRAYERSLQVMGLERVDLYLIHWPIPGTRADTWRALTRLYETGMVRAVGVSNYTVRHLKELEATSELVPAVNQFELHTYFQRKELVSACHKAGIQVESYSPLARGRKMDDPALISLADRYGKTPAQVMIRWGLQKGFVMIPKSVRRERIVENADVYDFELSDEDMSLLESFDVNMQIIRPGFMEGEW
jgi:diketogulonate reductase-like aldo/keto reductase